LPVRPEENHFAIFASKGKWCQSGFLGPELDGPVFMPVSIGMMTIGLSKTHKETM